MKNKLASVGGCLILFLASSSAAAQVRKERDPNSKIKDLPVCGRDVYADLTITGAEVRKSDDIIVTVQSKGACDAPRSRLSMWIYYVKTDRVAFYKQVDVPAIKTGETAQLKLYWVSGTYGSMADGSINIKFMADAKFQIKEEDEYNNEFILKP